MNLYNFNKLSPEVSENKGVYNKALDFAFDDDDIKNIAITGIYGAGKSTVWYSYLNGCSRKIRKKSINVSLGVYFVEPPKSMYRVEKQIINQISCQVPNWKTPLSKYRFKKNTRVYRRIIEYLFILSIVYSLFCIYNGKHVSISYLFILIVVGLFFTLKYNDYKYKFSSIKIHKTKIKLAGRINKDDSIFDRDIEEIIYLIKTSGAKVVVFEDLDRYGSTEIFDKLKELNTLVNFNAKKTIRFVYIINEGMLDEKKRTKFFDFILPIIPIVNNETSEAVLKEILPKGICRPSDEVITKTSYYIDDMRILKNITNEYIVYSNKECIELDYKLDKDKLFSVVVLKNIFPKEFNLLQENSGYVHNIFSRKEEIKNISVESIVELIKKVQIIEKKDKFTSRHNEQTEKLRIQLDEADDSKLCRLLKNISGNELEKIFIHSRYIGEHFQDVINSHYFPLLKFQILEGYIDETYMKYIGASISGSNDKIFLKNSFAGIASDPFLELENPGNVISKLYGEYLNTPHLNKSILKHVLKEGNNKLVESISQEEYQYNTKMLISILKSLDDKLIFKYTKIILNYNFLILSFILSENEDTNLKNIILLTIYSQKDDEVISIHRFDHYLNSCDETLINSIPKKMYAQFDVALFYHNITNASFKIKEVDKIEDLDELPYIQNYYLYEVNFDNIIHLSKNIGKDDKNNDLLSKIYDCDDLSKTKLKVKEYISDFIEEYMIYVGKEATITSNYEVLTDVIKSDLDADYVLEYINRCEVKKLEVELEDLTTNLEKVIYGEKRIIDILFEKNLISSNKINHSILKEYGYTKTKIADYHLKHTIWKKS